MHDFPYSGHELDPRSSTLWEDGATAGQIAEKEVHGLGRRQ